MNRVVQRNLSDDVLGQDVVVSQLNRLGVALVAWEGVVLRVVVGERLVEEDRRNVVRSPAQHVVVLPRHDFTVLCTGDDESE